MPDEDGLYRLLIDKAPLKDIVMRIPPERYAPPDSPSVGELYFIPSSKMTHKIPHILESTDIFAFANLLDAFIEQFQLDAVIVDTNPTFSLFDGLVYIASDAFIYVTECERMSFDGVQNALEQMQNFQADRKRFMGEESRVIGIIPNKMRADTRAHRHNIQALAEVYKGLVWPPITLRTLWTEASNNYELIYTYAPTGQEAIDAWEIVNRVEKELKEWSQTEEIN